MPSGTSEVPHHLAVIFTSPLDVSLLTCLYTANVLSDVQDLAFRCLPSDVREDVGCPINVSEAADWLIEVSVCPLMSVDFHVIALCLMAHLKR